MKTKLKSIAIVSLFLSLLWTGQIHAYGAAGCGLGSVVITENKVVHQVIAATVNGFSANQLFGITTGTLNCKTDGVTHKEREAEIFVHLNYNSLILESAQGSGERLDTFARLMNCSEPKRFADFAQKNHANLFSSEDPSDFLSKIKIGASQDETLSKICKL
ncbi:DUF3015 domain-containing protein [Leptospira gomenensis]|uniref:DUF3015 domain-containing protein n=1 Tax=Leptospira gomenensis TaxID=2484974 RepID=A0A5F1Y8A8_9LEPT|nr:DUF3015 family protein [Leptospira gomenensis]TGK31504.1 DUF3015 domain-containing protein [Leptospira gomenensis]TGK32494.1 DUF3015 domain-containing protein [Leptospira gomenensis]TGK46209.1 DUF3015 domain-containing protein [Leptospira gomenensis]TGK54734.1 DUF3015 domain-containing protein [Leptospira gomenensis]